MKGKYTTKTMRSKAGFAPKLIIFRPVLQNCQISDGKGGHESCLLPAKWVIDLALSQQATFLAKGIESIDSRNDFVGPSLVVAIFLTELGFHHRFFAPYTKKIQGAKSDNSCKTSNPVA